MKKRQLAVSGQEFFETALLEVPRLTPEVGTLVLRGDGPEAFRIEDVEARDCLTTRG